jgi:tRNA(Ile)-lysidine synthetase-like protein
VAVVKRAVRIAFSKVFGVELSSQSVNNIINLIGRPNGVKMSVVDEIVASVQYSGIVIQEGSDDKMMAEFNLRTDVDHPVVLFMSNMSIRYDIVEANNVVNNANYFYCPVHLCRNGFKLRTRRDGDVISIAPGIRKKLKKFFVDEKIDAAKRDDYWLLVNEENEVVWVPGLFGSRLKTEDRSGEFVKFEIADR